MKLQPPETLAFSAKIRISAPFVGSGRELNGRSQQIHPLILMWQGQSARRPVLPPSEQLESFPKVSKGLSPGTAPTLGKDIHASL